MLLCLCHVITAAVTENKETYIVHMANHQMPLAFQHHSRWYDSSLKAAAPSAEMLYAYDTAVHGFSARLTPEEARSLRGQAGITAVLPEVRYQLHTTRTPVFLGLERSADLFPDSASARDVVVGVLDTGVWPDNKSFNDGGLGPVPATWRGECERGTNFSAARCNRKLVGARFFSRGYEAALGLIDPTKEPKSPLDVDGHGTHTSTTAAGSVVPNVSLLGYAYGNARGMAKQGRVAVYKVCWVGGCFASDILAAIDKAVADNVNVLSMSLGGGMSDYYGDSVAIGAFAAMEKGIFVSCSAGNSGPISSSLSNVAPWITTVGAGTIDRDFPAYVKLGNGVTVPGVSLYRGAALSKSPMPFVFAGDASNSTNGNLCLSGTLDSAKVDGKLVLCERGISARVQKGLVVKAAGGRGMVLMNTAASGEELVADAHLLPAAAVGQVEGEGIKKYLSSNPNATATILFEETKVGIQPSPVVAAFSSRGPNPITPSILKPDLIAPGVNILAGWTGLAGPTGQAADTRRVEFNIISGTSMSCPHVSGLAALLKAAHPEWSPAAVRSALMTTAYVRYKTGQKIRDSATGSAATPLDYGAGHVDPVAAKDPGLVYDLAAPDYLDFLCALNYTAEQMSLVARRRYACAAGRAYSVGDLNYPSFAVPFESATMGAAGRALGSGKERKKYTRTVTNVGGPGTYRASVSSESKGVKISVVPPVLRFSKAHEKKTFTVTFTAVASMPSNTNAFGRIEWTDGKHVVGSPVAFTWT